MNSFALVWGKLIHSSIWVKESKETRLVWITMLVMKDHAGQVHSSVVGLADAAKVSVEECRMALEVLLSPDLDDTSGVDGGRRIRAIPGGWEVINHDLYRFSTDSKREFWRQQKADYRARQKKPSFRSKMSKTPSEKQFEETGQMPDERPVNGEPPLQWDNEADS